MLRARPPKEFRDEDSSPRRFTRDDRWVLGGLTLAAALLIGYVGYWTNWFGLTAPDTPPPPPSGGEAAPATGTTVGSWVVLGLFAVFSLGVLVWIWWGLRDDGAKLDQLPADEQARRQQIAALLRQVEPPVSEEEAPPRSDRRGSTRRPGAPPGTPTTPVRVGAGPPADGGRPSRIAGSATGQPRPAGAQSGS